MASYEPPVSQLLKLGRPEFDLGAVYYSTLGIGAEHIPDLIRLLGDEEMYHADSDAPEVYAQIHAWRALGELKAEAAIDPLLDLLANQEDEDDWNDWVTEEVPKVLAMIGPAALPRAATRLEQHHRLEHAPVEYSQTLTEIAKSHPQTRADVVDYLSRMLQLAAENDPSVNGFIISDLIDLKAVEAWPVVEAAFKTSHVNVTIVGDVDYARWHFGLGPKPPTAYRLGRPVAALPLRGTAKQRAEERARQRKAEKRRNKKRGR